MVEDEKVEVLKFLRTSESYVRLDLYVDGSILWLSANPLDCTALGNM